MSIAVHFKENFIMKTKNPIINFTALVTIIVFVTLTSASAIAVNDAPLTENWAPSEWGADDKAGSVNWTTPEMVLKAARLVKRGKVATLG